MITTCLNQGTCYLLARTTIGRVELVISYHVCNSLNLGKVRAAGCLDQSPTLKFLNIEHIDDCSTQILRGMQ